MRMVEEETETQVTSERKKLGKKKHTGVEFQLWNSTEKENSEFYVKPLPALG